LQRQADRLNAADSWPWPVALASRGLAGTGAGHLQLKNPFCAGSVLSHFLQELRRFFPCNRPDPFATTGLLSLSPARRGRPRRSCRKHCFEDQTTLGLSSATPNPGWMFDPWFEPGQERPPCRWHRGWRCTGDGRGCYGGRRRAGPSADLPEAVGTTGRLCCIAAGQGPGVLGAGTAAQPGAPIRRSGARSGKAQALKLAACPGCGPATALAQCCAPPLAPEAGSRGA